jgi:hypothetical protein
VRWELALVPGQDPATPAPDEIGSLAPGVANPAGYDVVAFRGGYGDGTYATYVGPDVAGRPVCLLTNFALR